MAIDPRIALAGQVPDIGKTFSNVLLNVSRFEDIQRAREADEIKRQELGRQEQVRQALGQIGAPEELMPGQAGPTQILSQDELIQQARQIDPVFANKQLEQLGLDDPSKRAEASRFAAEVQSLPLEQQNQRIKRRIQDLSAQGRDPSDTAELLGMNTAERAQTLQGVQLLDLSTKERITAQQKAAGRTGLVSAKTDILESGATIQVLPSGETVVTDPAGVEVTGQKRLDILKESRELERKQIQERADVTVTTARRVKKIEAAAKTADKAFGMVESIRNNITNLREVTPLIGQGASTGPIVSLFPSIKSQTIKLEQLQRRLGLDVVGATTFGALSKGELDLAKSVALPLGLEGDALIQWVNDTIAAKEKLANYYEEQAIFLSQGNSQADWLQKKRSELKAIMGDATEADIRQTMKANNMTRPQVLQEMRRRQSIGGT